jgi:hypothetical protein
MFTSVYLSSPQLTSVYFSLPQLTSAYLSLPQLSSVFLSLPQFASVYLSLLHFTTVYLSTPQYTSVYISLPQFTSVQLSLPQFTSVYLSVPQFTSDYHYVIKVHVILIKSTCLSIHFVIILYSPIFSFISMYSHVLPACPFIPLKYPCMFLQALVVSVFPKTPLGAKGLSVSELVRFSYVELASQLKKRQ